MKIKRTQRWCENCTNSQTRADGGLIFSRCKLNCPKHDFNNRSHDCEHWCLAYGNARV
jgi:hypothetical protein